MIRGRKMRITQRMVASWGGLRAHGASQSDGSGYGKEYKSGSATEESRYGPKPSDRLSAFPTAPYRETVYGGLPTMPSADPLVKELSQ